LKKPRIKISLKNSGSKKKASKQKMKSGKKTAAAGDVEGDEGNQGDDEATPATKRKRKRADKTDPSKKISRKRAKKTEAASKPSVAEESPAKAENPIVEVAVTGPTSDETSAVYLDVDLWKAERESLDGSFKAARAHFLERGPWKLPADVGESKFRTVAKQTLMKMGR
jgi:hypothetical protein